MEAPVVAARIECAGGLRNGLRRGARRTDRCRTGKHERGSDKDCPDQALHDGLPLLIEVIEYASGNLAGLVRCEKRKQARNATGLFDIGLNCRNSPAVPVAAMVMVPAIPVMMTVIAVVSPVYFRRRLLAILLNRRGGARIAERERIGALGRGGQREQGANGRQAQNFHDLHM
jgi:hypothetical protein